MKIGDLVQYNSAYESPSPPSLGIITGIKIDRGPITDLIWYRVWIWGTSLEFLEEEITLVARETSENR